MDEPDLHAMLARAKSGKRFRIGFSFPGNPHRDRVATLVKLLRRTEPGIALFYDKDHEADITGKELKPLFKTLYRDCCDFVVALVCPAYFESEYCRWEWKTIKKRMKKQRDSVYLVQFDDPDGDIPRPEMEFLKKYGMRPYTGNDDLVELAEEIYRQLHRRCPLSANEIDNNYRKHIRWQIESLFTREGGRLIREAIDRLRVDFPPLSDSQKGLPALELLFQCELIDAIALLEEAVNESLRDTTGDTHKFVRRDGIDLLGRLVLLAVEPAWVAGKPPDDGVSITAGIEKAVGMAVLVARLDDTRADFHLVGARVYGSRQLHEKTLAAGEAGWIPRDNVADMVQQIAEIIFSGKVDGLDHESLCEKINYRMLYDRRSKRDIYISLPAGEKPTGDNPSRKASYSTLEKDLKDARFVYFGTTGDQAPVFRVEEKMLETAVHRFLQMLEAYPT